MGFDSSKKQLTDWLRNIHEARLQLPDFQRGWVWSDQAIRSLVASIANGYPVGALLTLETGGAVQFKPRLLEGVPDVDVRPEELLLDGQQRMTSLYQALRGSQAVRTHDDRGRVLERYYYLDLHAVTRAGTVTEEMVLSVPAARMVKGPLGHEVELDVSSPEREHQAHLFPLNQALDERDWLRDWRFYWLKRLCGPDSSPPLREIEDTLHFLTRRIQRYEMPFIRLDRNNSRQAICTVFEKVNTGGKKLDAFELLTAIYAAEPMPGEPLQYFDLRIDWHGDAQAEPPTTGRARMLKESGTHGNVLEKVASTEFLQACLLIHTRRERERAEGLGKQGKELPAVSARNEDLLDLPRAAYLAHADRVQKGFVQAAQFLNEERILFARDIPYPPQLVTLATVFAEQEHTLNATMRQRLARWYWAIALSESYSASTETKIARDVPELMAWLRESDKPAPRTLEEALFRADRLDTLRTRISSAYRAVQNLLIRQGCRDFKSGKEFGLMTTYKEPIDVHHVFPEKWCKDRGIAPAIYNSILNKTPLSAESNRSIGGDAPSKYLTRLQSGSMEPGLDGSYGSATMDVILRSHLIDPEKLRADDFYGFLAQRKVALVGLIATTMGREVVMDKQGGPDDMASIHDVKTLAGEASS